MSRELLQKCLTRMYGHFWADDLCADLREALAQPQAEPVCWALPRGDGFVLDVICPDEHKRHEGGYTVPLYATPPAQPAPAPVVPEGWVMVPREPTVEMRRAAAKWLTHYHLMRPADKTNAITDAWIAMIAAAPGSADHG